MFMEIFFNFERNVMQKMWKKCIFEKDLLEENRNIFEKFFVLSW